MSTMINAMNHYSEYNPSGAPPQNPLYSTHHIPPPPPHPHAHSHNHYPPISTTSWGTEPYGFVNPLSQAYFIGHPPPPSHGLPLSHGGPHIHPHAHPHPSSATHHFMNPTPLYSPFNPHSTHEMTTLPVQMPMSMPIPTNPNPPSFMHPPPTNAPAYHTYNVLPPPLGNDNTAYHLHNSYPHPIVNSPNRSANLLPPSKASPLKKDVKIAKENPEIGKPNEKSDFLHASIGISQGEEEAEIKHNAAAFDGKSSHSGDSPHPHANINENDGGGEAGNKKQVHTSPTSLSTLKMQLSARGGHPPVSKDGVIALSYAAETVSYTSKSSR